MELLFLFIGLGIFSETTFLAFKSLREKKPIYHGRRKVFVDTSALMDGRILAVARTGFLSDDFFIPKSVIREMQTLADGKDADKRSRARRGLDAANELERIEFFETRIFNDDSLGKMVVDERLLELAREHRGIILTTDYNLAKVAKTENIEVLNVNDMAMVFTCPFKPGEKFKIRIIGRGNNPKQGVGYLEDGTMVIVEKGEKFLKKETEVRFLRFLQTGSGKMIFAELATASRSQLRRTILRKRTKN